MESINMFQCPADNYEGAELCSTLRCINEDDQQKMQEQEEERKIMICIKIRLEIEKLVYLIKATKNLKKCKKNLNHVNKLIKIKNKLFKDLKAIEGNSINFLNKEISKKIILPTCKLDANESKYIGAMENLTRQLQKKEAEINEEKNMTEKVNYKNHVLKQMLSKLASNYHELDAKNKTDMEIKENELKQCKESLQEKLSEAKEELQNIMSQQFSQKAEHTETLKKEISLFEQKIIILETEKLKILNLMEHDESVNRKKCDDLKRKLEKVTQDRDEKIQEISTFVKLFDDLKILADASAAEKSRLSGENIVLQKEANEARHKLEERDNLKSQSDSLQEKLEETITTHKLQVNAQKKIESELQKQLSKHLSEYKEAIAAKNKIMHEKEIAIQHIKVTEKELGIKNIELNMKRVQFTNLQQEHDMLTAKLNKCEEVIKRLNIASEKLHKENQDQAQNILNLEHHIKVLNNNLSQKEKKIALTEQHCDTLNNVHQSLGVSVNECTKLKNLAEKFNQHNNELMGKCKLLENDLEQLEIKIKTSTKKLLSVEEEKKNLIKSMNELTNENSLLHEATNQLALLEMEKSSQNEKLRHLTDNCNKLDEELTMLRKELITSQETKQVLEKQNEIVMKIQADLRSRFCTLTADYHKLRGDLVSESSQRRKFYIQAERLKCVEALLSSNAKKMAKENHEISMLLAQRELKIEKLQVVNKKFIKKINDLQLSYNKDMAQKTSDAIENAKECTSLRLKNQGLITKVMKHIRMNKQLKDKCKELHNETENQNNLIKNLKHEKEGIQVENEKLKLELKATHRKKQEQATKQQEVVKIQSKKKPPSQQPEKESIPSRTLRACNRVKQLVKRD